MTQSELASQLRALCGEGTVIANEDELLVYECDAYTMQKNLPTAVVLPRTTEEVQTEGDDAFASLLQMLGGPGNADALRTLCRGAGFHATDDVLASGGGQTDEEGVLRKLAEAAMEQGVECALAA